MSKEFLHYNQDFFQEVEFSVMIFVILLFMVLLTSILKIVPSEALNSLVESQLTQYIIYLQLGMVCFYLTKDSFNLGLFKITDETRLEVAMAVKAFAVTYLCMSNYSTKSALDFDVNARHRELKQRWNLATKPFGLSHLDLSPELTYVLFALVAAVISFVTVRTSVRFAFYFYNTID